MRFMHLLLLSRTTITTWSSSGKSRLTALFAMAQTVRMTLQIRRAVHEDAAKIIAAHRRSIREVCAEDYRPEQIAAWSGRNFQEDRWCRTMDQDMVWVISDDEKNIYGFGHLLFTEKPSAVIAGLYFVPEIIGQGYGRQLIQIMLGECTKRNIQNISLSATVTAKSFYESAGFQQVGEMSTFTFGDQAVECFHMKWQPHL